MRLQVELVTDRDLLRDMQQAHALIPGGMGQFARRDLRPFASKYVDTTLRQEPPVRSWPGDYPEGRLEWTSDKQRRYVHAFILDHDEDGNVIPYVRTHQFVHQWHVLADYTNGLTSIIVSHGDPGDKNIEQYITGRRQQRFHQITGWPSSTRHLRTLRLAMNQRIRDGMPSVVQQAWKDAV